MSIKQFQQFETIFCPVVNVSAKRICKLVVENRSCVHDYIFYFVDQVECKNPKRSFREYSTGLKDNDTRRMLINPDRGETGTVKRYRLSTD